ncbi:MAG: type II toxin-antitoxin system PemK/MazF family toxin [Candidatus Eremiobacteraeota bacterium]|nr:type II toxin-antitoxin system PemK/MazF family toxin [Candidatus Eremiobacteraeota bacterium]
MRRPRAGSIVVVDWRGGVPPNEPNRLRPAVVIDDHRLFPDEYGSIFVAPMTRDETIVHPAFAVSIEPSAKNGCGERCWIMGNYASVVSLARVRTTASAISDDQLVQVRLKLSFMIGFPQVSPLVQAFAASQ